MRSATSYFNSTLYAKTMARFWPLWGMWGLGWMFLLPLHLLTWYFEVSGWRANDPREALLAEALNIPSFLGPGVILALVFGVLCAMAVFGYLYSSRSACWTHALPLRREALFTTQYLAGLSFLLLPQLAAAVLAAVVELALLPAEAWGPALSTLLIWLLAQSGISLFFFSFASFCAMFTGHILALPAFYFILNWLAGGLYYLLDALMHEFFYGYAGMPGAEELVQYLVPASILSSAAHYYNGEEYTLHSPGTIAAYAAIGVALALVSLYVYRRRHVESAGDVVAVPLVRPLFRYGVALCSGLAFGMVTAAFFNLFSLAALIPCILIWTVIGYFVAEMFLKKSFRVFRAWKGAAVLSVLLLAFCLVCLLDVFGVVARVPDAGQVRELEVEIDLGYPSDGGQYLYATITDPAEIEKFIALHQAIVDSRDEADTYAGRGDYPSDYISVELRYELTGGRLFRSYRSFEIREEDLDTPGTPSYAARQLAEDRELLAQAYGFDDFLEGRRLSGAYLERVRNPEGDTDSLYLDDAAQALWDAVQQDFAEGNLGARYLIDRSQARLENTYRTDLIFEATQEQTGEKMNESRPSSASVSSLSITLTPQARRTLAALEETGIFEEGYALTPWETGDSDPYYPDTMIEGGSEIVY